MGGAWFGWHAIGARVLAALVTVTDVSHCRFKISQLELKIYKFELDQKW